LRAGHFQHHQLATYSPAIDSFAFFFGGVRIRPASSIKKIAGYKKSTQIYPIKKNSRLQKINPDIKV
jgi:hypothetical protein